MAVCLAKVVVAELRRNTCRIGNSSVSRNLITNTFLETMADVQRKRGAFIVLEGCDRTGKTSQCKQLVETLNQAGVQAKYMNFPDRSTRSGELINAYLTKKGDFTDEGIHLLFTLNRWERTKEMEELLRCGVNLIVDRYSFSGVAFTSAKGLDIEWCKAPESGLLKPDLVLLLTLSPEALSKRGGFGDERYEVPEFQKKVIEKYLMLKDDRYWKVIDADKNFDDLASDLCKEVLLTIDKSGNNPIEKLW